MEKTSILTLITIILCIKNIFSQSATINNLTYQSEVISNCGNIYFNLNSSHTIEFDIVLSRQYDSQNPNLGAVGEIKVLYWTGSGEMVKVSYDIKSSGWSISGNYATYTKPVSITLNTNDFDNTTGGSLYVRFHDTTQNFFYESCEYNIIAPEFTFSHENIIMECDDDSLTTFEVDNVNNIPGNLSYIWNVGNGWEQDGIPINGTFTTTNSSITLKPVSGLNLPSNVSVTTILDGASYPTMTAIISRKYFNPKYSISGQTEVCNNETFTINNLDNQHTITWSSSNNYIATITPINNYQATVTKVGDGTITITATVINLCGQQKVFTKKLVLGAVSTEMVNFTNGLGESGYFCSSHNNNTYEIFPYIENTNHQIRIKSLPYMNIVYTSNFNTGNTGTLNYYPSPGWYLFEVRRSSSCGTSSWIGYEIEFVDCSNGGETGEGYRIFPNPTSNTLTIAADSNENYEINTQEKDNSTLSYELYDFDGVLIVNGILTSKVNIDVTSYKKGTYILKINTSKSYKTHSIIIN